ncbi:type 2 lanthipeptide synthetase LanM family protein [Clostridium paraputrificum]|uniref:type 2 lanthipeptide synthetase LanM family protein n=1 Tax=Clostridium paraputrificum TaxID=29363 RepID=UPI003D350A03
MGKIEVKRRDYWIKLFPKLKHQGELNDLIMKCSSKNLESLENEFNKSLKEKIKFSFLEECNDESYEEIVNNVLDRIELNFRWAHFFKPLILAHTKELYKLVKEIRIIENKEEFFYISIFEIVKKMQRTSYRVLISQINTLSKENKLVGNSPKERGDYFKNVVLRDKNYLNSVYEFYPELSRLLMILVKNEVNFISNILVSTDKEFINLVDIFNIDNKDRLKGFSLSSGDTHNDGKSVTILNFTSGKKLLYKPRNIEIDYGYKKFIKWLNSKNIDGYYNLYSPKVYSNSKKNEGWVEFIEYKECRDDEGVKRFYKRIGEILCLFHLFNSTDFHYENLIAGGEYPILIDLETVLNPKVYEKVDEYTALMMVNKTINDSIYSCGLLPRNIISNKNEKYIDISGLSVDKEQEDRIKSNVIENYDTDEVRLVRKYMNWMPKNNNPKLGGQIIESKNYVEEIKEGFINLYRWVMKNRSMSKEKVIEIFNKRRCRVVIRTTNVYDQILNTSYHPQLLENTVDRKVYLSRIALSLNSIVEQFVEEEYKQLLNGDIPYFMADTDKKDICYGEEGECKNIYENCILDDICNNIDSCNELDLERQVSMINMSFEDKLINSRFNITNNKFIQKDEYKKYNRKDALKIAEDVGNYILRKSIKGKKDGREELMWIGVRAVIKGNVSSIWASGTDLYNGNAGIGLFLAYLGELTNNEKFKNAALEVLNPIINPDEEEQNIGAFNGLAGNIYILYNVGKFMNKQEFIDFAYKEISLLVKLIDSEDNYDVIGGQAGIILVATSLYKVIDDEKVKKDLLNIMNVAYEQIKRQAITKKEGHTWSENGLLGFAHGNAGVEAALIKFFNITEREDALDLLKSAIKFDRRFFNKEKGGWPRAAENYEVYSNFWCNGNAGMLLSRLILIEEGYKDKLINEEIRFCIKRICTKGIGNDFSLCHGDLGNLLVLYRAAEVLKDEVLKGKVISTFNNYLENFEKEKIMEKEFKYTEKNGIMIGISGIGYSILKFLYYDVVPDILCFEQ